MNRIDVKRYKIRYFVKDGRLSCIRPVEAREHIRPATGQGYTGALLAIPAGAEVVSDRRQHGIIAARRFISRLSVAAIRRTWPEIQTWQRFG
jgi:hypothetical protein